MPDQFLHKTRDDFLYSARWAFRYLQTTEHALGAYSLHCRVMQIKENLQAARAGYEVLDVTGRSSAEEIKEKIKASISRISLISAHHNLAYLEKEPPKDSGDVANFISLIREQFEAAGIVPDQQIEDRLTNIRNRSLAPKPS